MGTLYECLREARLEQFYPAFRANGITRSEALINLGMPEFFALGITSNEDKRRLIELVNIIKSVHSSGLSGSHSSQRHGTVPHQSHSSNVNLTNDAVDISPNSGRITRHVRRQPSPSSRGSVSREVSASTVQHLEPSRDVIVQDRVLNYSFAMYKDILRQISESSESDAAADHTDEEQTIAQITNRNISSASAVRTSTSKGSAIERIKHSKRNSYNYGVHKVSTPTKTKTSRSGIHRSIGEEKIKVCVRKRPLTRREHRAKEEDIVLIESTNTLIVNESKLAVDLKAYTLQHEFVFDEVFDESCTNEDVYIRAARPLISCIFNGGTATCFAYGQTGAGKTHTMLGGENAPGLYLLAGQDIFSLIQSGTYGRGLHVWVSFFEIYCGQLFDLLNRRSRLQAREDGSRQVCIAGLTETEATSVTSLVQILEYGNSVRSKGASGVNPDSSRSHAVLQLDIRNSEDTKIGKISFIDLAGSERASDVTDSDKQTRIEGAEINQSLLALKECIRSIDQDSRHTPFRQSKLTHILKDSFVGNSRTCMIANVSPTQVACENTLNTLRYADRVKELKRDSTRSSSVGQAMNLLMNIPPTAPSIFHPSNILSSSTPMRASSQLRREKINAPLEVFLDPMESPIRGHNIQRRQKENLKSQQGLFSVQTAAMQSRIDQLNMVSAKPHVPPGTVSRSSAHATAASQGASVPPPDASPSESEQTDTDSCNITKPTVTLSGILARQIAVAKSTDSEFDFPTSDFNNIDDFNDLNLSGKRQRDQNFPQQKRSHPSGQMSSDDQGTSAAAAAGTISNPSVSSSITAPVLRPVIYRSLDPVTELANVAPLSQNPQIPEVFQEHQSSILVSTQGPKHPPSFKKNHLKELDTSDDSVNEDELFSEGPTTHNTSQQMNNLGTQSGHGVLTLEKTNSVSFINWDLMIPQPVDLSQRQNPRSADHSTTAGTNIASARNTNIGTFVHQEGASIMLGDTAYKIQSKITKSPAAKQRLSPVEKSPIVETNFVTRNTLHQQLSRQVTQPSRQSPSDQSQTSSLFMAQQSTNSPNKSHEESFHGSNAQYHSDGSDSGGHQKTSPLPNGEVSGDSLDSIRASLSDQGHDGNRYHSSSSMRKGRSDPMLALDTQRKKHTLPDPQSFSKMLTRSNMPKPGKVPRDAGWKVIHNELPLSHPAEDFFVSGNRSNELGSLIPADIDDKKEITSEQLGHFSDSSYYSSTARERKRASVAKISIQGKQLPQVPAPNLDLDINTFAGQAEHQDISQSTTDASSTGFKLAVKNNSAIVTEKLSSGAVFSPIHPSPVTLTDTKSAVEPAVSSSILYQPTPVSASSSSNLDTATGSLGGAQEALSTASLERKMQLVAAHEDQLATITSLCKYEMRLLLSAKKVMGKRGFDDYLRRVNDILQQKMAAIVSLHDQISLYRSHHSQNSSVVSSIATSVSDSGTSLNSNTSLLQK